MDNTSMRLMGEIIQRHGLNGMTIVDMGSYDVNGTYRGLFTKGKYIGADISGGPNVDVIVGSEKWKEISNIDAVISGQTLEHVADIPGFMAEVQRILKPGGIFCIIAPSDGPRHDYPIWVGNYSKERMHELVMAGGFEIVSCEMDETAPWKLVVCVARKKDSIS